MKHAICHITSRISLLILMVWAVGLLTACRQKDLVYAGEPVKILVNFDWQRASGADPEGMTLILFPADGTSRIWRFDISGRDGGEIELLAGVYNVLAYNSDLPGVRFTDTDSYDRYSATAGSAGDSIASPTGMLYAAHLSSAHLFNTGGRSPSITLTPDSLSAVYHIRVDSVSGTERIKTASAIIKGVASSVCLQLQGYSSACCNLSAPLHINAEDRSTLETVTTGFGVPDIPDPKMILEVVVTTSHGKYLKQFDVTSQVVNSIDPRNVNIYIKGLDIPEADTPANPDVGISVGVDGWQLIEITYS